MKVIAIFMLMIGCALGQVQFDGVNQLVEFDDSDSFSGDRTICGWLRLNSYDDLDTIASHQSGFNANEVGFLLRIRTGNILQLYNGIGNNDLMTNSFTEIAHFAVVQVGTDIKSYLNGRLESEQSSFIGYNSGNQLYSIMGRASTAVADDRFCNGVLIDYRHYSRVLSSSEIAQIANPRTAWMHADDPAIVMRTCVDNGQTGSTITGAVRNYGSGANGTAYNSPKVSATTIQTRKPISMEIP